jgi:hypothetical protein
MIKNRRILILGNDDNGLSQSKLASSLAQHSNTVYLVRVTPRNKKFRSSFEIKDSSQGYFEVNFQLGWSSTISKFLGSAELLPLAREFVFGLGRLFDMVISFPTKEIKDLSVFAARKTLLLLDRLPDGLLINSSVDQIVLVPNLNDLDLIDFISPKVSAIERTQVDHYKAI